MCGRLLERFEVSPSTAAAAAKRGREQEERSPGISGAGAADRAIA